MDGDRRTIIRELAEQARLERLGAGVQRRVEHAGAVEEVDLADAHVRALEHARTRTGALALNVGTGRGYSVLELVRAFEQASGRKVPHEVVARRSGDVAELWADPARAKQLLGWSASRGIEAMCADTWRWQRDNPDGYRG